MTTLYRLVRYTMPFVALVALVLLLSPSAGPEIIVAQESEQPATVHLAGTINSALGCGGDWQTDCEFAELTFDEEDQLWEGEFELPAGEYEYKVAINGTWDENYGAGAEPDGSNISLVLEEDTTVQFFYDHNTHWVADNVNFIIANVPGDYQSQLGCGEWAPSCLRSWLQDPDGDGVYVFGTTAIAPGDYEAKVALNQSWDLNYGADGAPDGANIAFSVSEEGSYIEFQFDTATNVLSIFADGEAPAVVDAGQDDGAEDTTEDATPDTDTPPAGDAALMPPIGDAAQEVEQPQTVHVPGTINSALGCGGDWQTDCEFAELIFDEEDQLWEGEFELPAGEYEYKVAINGTWDENYGVGAVQDGPNISLVLEEDTTVEFYYDHRTHWIADNVNFIIANVPGNYQSQLGCGEWEPWCLRSWLQDPDGDGIYIFGTTGIAAGSYEAKVALNQSWALNYGADALRDGPNIQFTVPEEGSYIQFQFDTSTNLLSIFADGEVPMPPVGDIGQAQAHWVTADTIAWDIEEVSGSSYYLYYSSTGDLVLNDDNMFEGGERIELRLNRDGLSEDVIEKFPHLRNYMALTIQEADLGLVPEILRGQMVVHASFISGEGQSQVIGATSLQIPGVLDDLYTYDGDLGLVWNDGVPSISVWAPTAQSVRFHLYDDANPETESQTFDMAYDADTGVWSLEGSTDWNYKYYLFEVVVYAPSTGQVETNMVSDPYSYSLSINSGRSQIVDLNDPALMPEGWLEHEKSAYPEPEDIVLYELHIRDFSVNDPTVPEDVRGTFAAFAVEDSNGMRHLQSLSDAGLTHVHMLPLFDIATINEDKSTWAGPSFDELAAFAGDSDEQQALIDPVRDEDGFNWGYDPYHYTVPEGSYSTDPNGAQRIIEFRQMVMSLNEIDLFVVMDVVYNHTNAAGQSDRSVLDRIVPGYYHRLDENGNVATSTCCQNTATEHNMMRKLMVDSVVTWSTAYGVDGYRFDLMGHHMLNDMIAVREALNELTLEADGMDGAGIYVYGEGWDFGEVQDEARGVNATQLNIAGTGIGAFNDRIRDAVRGGNPFGQRFEQGFATGVYVYPNGNDENGDEAAQLARALRFADQIRIGLAGNLEAYTFEDHTGTVVDGTQVDYNGSPAAYTQDPQENIVYVSAHDNETFFDAVQYKMPQDATLMERARAQNMGVSIVALSQGVPFFHAGIELMRTKSLDRNSYNSGDWFNRVDWTYETNYWPMGLPPEGDNGSEWANMQPILENEGIAPGNAEILLTLNHFREMLQIRQSTPLFGLPTGEDVINRVAFHNTGTEQVTNLIVMSITDTGDVEDIDPNYDMVVVLFNARTEEVTFTVEDLAGMGFELHPVQAASYDEIVQGAAYDAESGTFTVPAFTTAVFVAPQG